MSDAAVKSRGVWAGRTMQILVVVFLLANAGVQFFFPEVNAPAMAMVGLPMSVVPLLGTIMLVCAILYAIPQSAVIGAILITGYLGGAICTNVRVGATVSPPVIICLVIGLLAWGGLYLQDSRVRAVLPRA